MREKLMQIVEMPSCDGNVEDICLYDPSTRCFVEMFNEYSIAKSERYPRLSFIPVEKKFESLFANGSHSPTFEAYVQVNDFRRLFDEILDSCPVPLFNEGEIVWKFEEFSDNRKRKPVLYKVDQVVGWKKQTGCNLDMEPMKVECIRKFIRTDTGAAIEKSESYFKPLKYLEDWKEGKSVINKVVSSLKKELPGGLVFYAGDVYSF